MKRLGLVACLLTLGCFDFNIDNRAGQTQGPDSTALGPSGLPTQITTCAVAFSIRVDIRGSATIAVGGVTSTSFSPLNRDGQPLSAACSENLGFRSEVTTTALCEISGGTVPFFPDIRGLAPGACIVRGEIPESTGKSQPRIGVETTITVQ